jgi:Cof subfamily protein (haloacid dehalogenase superfamily)
MAKTPSAPWTAEALKPARDIRLLLSDVDGTLVTQDKVLTEDARDAARALRAAGVSLTIASSRPPRGLTMLVEPLGLTLPMIGCNGAVLVNPDLSVIEVHPIDAAAAAQAVAFLAKQGLDAWVYTETQWLLRDPEGAHAAREAWILGFDPVAVPSFDETHLARALKIVGVSDNYPLVAASEGAAQALLGKTASVTRSAAHFLDVTSPSANKGAAVSTLARRLNLSNDQIATIGDMPTDVLMFRQSGFSIAMGNASDAVKAQASVVTDTNENDGFAKAVRRFLLQPNCV